MSAKKGGICRHHHNTCVRGMCKGAGGMMAVRMMAEGCTVLISKMCVLHKHIQNTCPAQSCTAHMYCTANSR